MTFLLALALGAFLGTLTTLGRDLVARVSRDAANRLGEAMG